MEKYKFSMNSDLADRESTSFELQTRKAYEAFCRKIIVNKAINIQKRMEREAERLPAVDIDSIDDAEIADYPSLFYEDNYHLSDPVLVDLGFGTVKIYDQRLGYALRSLLLKFRAPVYLFFAMEYSDSEIAEILGISKRTVNDRKHRGLSKLQEKLEGNAHEFF